MAEWMSATLTFVATQLPKMLRKNLTKTILSAVMLTVLVEIAFLNPLFGSTKLKAQLLALMVGDAAEVEQLVAYISSGDVGDAKAFRIGAARAGYFTAQDQSLLDDWEREARRISWDQNAAKNLTALREARTRAEELRSPFQVIGRPVRASSPDCRIDRPGFGKIFVNQRRQIGTLLKPGATVKLINFRGGGAPVIAVVEYPDTSMPSDVDVYLNKFQMIKMLGQITPMADLRLSIVEGQPNQETDDDEPDGGTFCVARAQPAYVRG